MTKENPTIIDVAKKIAPVISSRDITDILRSAISKAKTKSVNLDFSDVEFISRSASHALLTMKEDLHRKFSNKKEIIFINTGENIQTMFRAIAANRAVPRPKPTFKPERINIGSL